MSALSYLPFGLPEPEFEWLMERVPSRELPQRTLVWKHMRTQGWDITALVAPDSTTVVALGCRGGIHPNVIRVRHQIEPGAQRLLERLGWRYVIDPSAPECELWNGDQRTPGRMPCPKCEATS